jgi:hypothetical protein
MTRESMTAAVSRRVAESALCSCPGWNLPAIRDHNPGVAEDAAEGSICSPILHGGSDFTAEIAENAEEFGVSRLQQASGYPPARTGSNQGSLPPELGALGGEIFGYFQR